MLRIRTIFRTPAIAAVATAAMALAGCGERSPVSVPVIAPSAAPNAMVLANPVAALSAGSYDFTSLNTTAIINGAKFEVSDFTGSTGTGVFDTFVRYNDADGTEQGYNTSGRPVAYDEFTAQNWTRDLRLDGVPVVNVGGILYREFRLDINEPSSASTLSVDQIQVFLRNTGGFTGTLAQLAAASTKIYDLDGDGNTFLKLDYNLFPGSGNGDLRMLIPNSLFPAGCEYDGEQGNDCSTYVVLYSQMGVAVSADKGGFEEWSIRKVPFVSVTKTATTTFRRTYNWDITKKATPTTLNLWDGTSGNVDYQVVASTTGSTDDNWAVSGQITVTNTSSVSAVINSVADVISGNISVTPNCNVAFPYTLASKGTLTCSYSSPLPDGTARTNTATVALAEGATYTGTANVTFGSPTTEVNKSVTVTDTPQGGSTGTLGTATAPAGATYNYQKTYACSADKGTKNNIARIVETNQTANASVTVNCYSLDVTKTAVPAAGIVYDWTITKNVSPASRTMYNGDQGEFGYTVGLTRSIKSQGFSVSGTITVANPATSSGNVTVDAAPTDVVSGGIAATVTCAGVSFPQTLTPGGSFQCAYSATLPDGATRTNVATATGKIPTNNTKPFSNSPVSINFAGVTPTETNATVTVTDPNDPGSPRGPFSATTSFQYTVTQACGSTRTVNNIATATLTDKSTKTANASITITCVSPTVQTAATTTYRRTYLWDVLKSRDQGALATLTLQAAQTYVYPFKVRVFTTGNTDDLFSASGTITVNGNAGVPGARSFTVTDAVTGGYTPAVTCTNGNPQSITGAGPINCTWGPLSLPDNSARISTAKATLQNVKYLLQGGPTNLGTTDVTNTANVSFAAATNTVRDNCVKVVDVAQHKDQNGGGLGSLITNQLTAGNFSQCVSGTPGSSDQTYTYTTTIGPMNQFASCGSFRFDNTATVTTNTTGATDNSSLQTPITVDCPKGCTLTQGFWKTHNASFGADKKGGRKGPPIYDWSQVNAGYAGYDLWTFYNGGLLAPGTAAGSPTWFQTWSTPVQGNPYYGAAHQFMAAVLNTATGAAAPTDVTSALSAADVWFKAHTDPLGALTDGDVVNLKSWSSLFGAYNEGSIGPGHCSEDKTSAS